MYERGTYGNELGNHRFGGSYGGPIRYYGGAPVAVGQDVAPPATPGFGFWNFVLTVGVGALTGWTVARDNESGAARAAGITLGTVGGLFLHSIMEQTHLLRRINQSISQATQ